MRSRAYWKFVAGFGASAFVALMLYLAFLAVVAYVAIHFIRKEW